MRGLRNWSFARVLLVSGGGIGVVSFGFNMLMLAIPIVPPLMLIAAWPIARRLNYSCNVISDDRS